MSDLQHKGIVIHVVALCETFLNEVNVGLANLENYTSVHTFRKDRPGGGVSIFVHDSIVLLKKLDGFRNDSIETIMIEAKHKNKQFVVTEVYRPPGTDNAKFKQSLAIIINKSAKYETSFMCGDLNYDLLKLHLHKPSEDVSEFLLSNGYLLLINKPTHVTHSTSTLIDNIYVRSKKLRNNESYIITDCMSDHYPCLLSYEMHHNTKCNPLVIEKHKLTEEAIFGIQHMLLHYNWNPLYNLNQDVNSMYTYLAEALDSAMDKFAPLRRVKIAADERFHEPWMMVSIKRCNAKCCRLCNKARNSTDLKQHKKYVQYCNILNRIKQQEKKSFYTDLFKKIGKNSKLLWEVVNNIVKKSNNKQSVVEILYKGKTIAEPETIANCFNEHFVSVGKKVHDTITKRWGTKKMLGGHLTECQVSYVFKKCLK